MSTPSNLYAEKVFSEHPTSLWALDDVADYISIISEEQRSFASWNIIGATKSIINSDSSPFLNSVTNQLTAIKPVGEIGQITCVSPDIVNFSDLNHSLKTFSIGGYFYSNTAAISSFEIGYEYYDVTTGTVVQKLNLFNLPINKKWVFLSETFEIPKDNTTARVVLKVNYFYSENTEDAYTFNINGITFGQWSEEFNSTSLGVQKTLIPTGIVSNSSEYGIPAVSYGLQQSVGYYLVNNNSLVAKNTGIPLVYGASSITKLSPNNGKPSLIIPGHGFLHENGKYNNYTFEMWLRVNNDSSTPKRIFGPIGSENGIYLDGPSIILKIDKYIGTYYVGEWGKPMLLNIIYGSNGASIVLNGEKVLSLPFNSSDISFTSNAIDWLGFWSYEDVSPIEVDSVAIYSYQVPEIVSKRRFVYGQGVEFPENINTSYSGSSVFIDYQYANYTNNYTYPDIGKWNQGIKNNLIIKNNILSTPEYTLPSLILESGDPSDLTNIIFNDSVQTEKETFFTFKPNNSWTKNGYLVFDNFNFLQEEIKAFYAVIKTSKVTTSDEVLLYIESQSTSNYFSIVLNGSNIEYRLHYGNKDYVVYTATGVTVGGIFPIGLDINKFANYFGQNILSFFGNRIDLKFYIGGNKKFDKSFHGKFYKVGFCNASNLSEIQTFFNERGCVLEYEDVFYSYFVESFFDAGQYTGISSSYWSSTLDGGSPSEIQSTNLLQHTSSYTLITKKYFNSYYFDIAVKSSWKDYLPLTYFSELVKDTNGDYYSDLDFIQFNIDYPSPSKFLEKSTNPVPWKYGSPTILENGEILPSLLEEYSNPTQKTYSNLDNKLYTKFNNYEDLKNKSLKSYVFDTSNSYVKSYVTFEYISNGSNSNDLYFTNIEAPSKNGIVDPKLNWINTKYEVVDNMIIYPPSDDIKELSLVTRLEFLVDGILTHKVNVKTLEYASQAFNDSSPNPVGTKFGTPIYPYKKSGYYYNYKDKNPFTIYKKSTPYLFLSRFSGITLRGEESQSVDRGLMIPINQTLAENYKVMAMQAAIRYDQDFFPYDPIKIFEIESKDQHIKFYSIANSSDGNRAKIYAINAKTGKLENGIAFYWNGKLVKEPIITIKEWGFLGISFSNILDFKYTTGSIKITGPITFNTISYYQTTTLQEVQQITTRPWFKIKYQDFNPLNWNFWSPAYNWQNVLVISTKSYYGVEPDTIYNSYVGTNKIIIDDSKVFKLGGYEYNFYQDASWQQNTVSAI